MKIILCFLALVGLTFNIWAQKEAVVTATTPVSIHNNAGTAKVPIEVAVKGRHEVTKYLGRQIDHVLVQVKGRSVATTSRENTYIISRGYLALNGFASGSFSSLEDAVSQIQFETTLFFSSQTPGIDVYLEMSVRDVDNNEVLWGFGNLTSTNQDGKGNMEGDFILYYGIPDEIEVEVGELIAGVKWVGGVYETRELSQVMDTSNWTAHSFLMSSSLLDNGFLCITTAVSKGDGPEAFVIDLSSGEKLSVRDMLTFFSTFSSGDVRVLRAVGSKDTDWTLGVRFEQIYGYTFGRYPLIELVTGPDGFADIFKVEIPVWGSTATVRPESITINRVDRPDESIPVSRREDGTWGMKLAPNTKYHMKVDFGNRVLDYNLNPWARG